MRSTEKHSVLFLCRKVYFQFRFTHYAEVGQRGLINKCGCEKALDIINHLSERNGFQTNGMKALGYTLTPFFRCKCEVPQSIASREEPVVFVCNHYEIFGPFAIVLSLPLRFRLWANSIVVDPLNHIDSMIVGTQHIFPFLSENAARKLLQSLTPVVERVVNRFKPIAVHREHLGKQRKAIEETVDAMLSGDNIVLFPETGYPAYSHGSVTEFYRSFALIGEFYRRKTGGSAAFCPIYVDKKHRRLQFGELVTYGKESAAVECGRIVDELRAQILQMAERALDQTTCLPS